MSDYRGSTVCQAMSNVFSVLFSFAFPKAEVDCNFLACPFGRCTCDSWVFATHSTGNMATWQLVAALFPWQGTLCGKIVEASDSESKESWSSSKPIRNCFLTVWKASIIKKCISRYLKYSHHLISEYFKKNHYHLVDPPAAPVLWL